MGGAFAATQTAAFPLPIAAKTFWRRGTADLLMRNFEVGPGGAHVYRLAARQRPGEPPPYLQACHRTDGVILQPNAPYQSGTDFGLLKWKFLDTVTVDMAVAMADGEAKLR